MKKFLLTVVAFSQACIAFAQLRLPAIFDDHMVIQQQSPVPIWGWSHPTQDVTIKVSWDTTTYRAKSDNATYWSTSIFSPVAGGPHTITINAGGEQRVLKDVMSGEVWICSGQSNMEWGMFMSEDGKTITEQIDDPMIRLFHIPKSAAETAQVRGEGQWRVCDKDAVRYFSAVAYFFGKKLNQQLNVPIGLIHASWGGTPAEAWLPKERIDEIPALREGAAKLVDDKPWCPTRPAVVYNSMINPLIPYRIAGALWYQGEANVGNAASTYRLLMEKVITEWRKQFMSDFPFYYVQIAPFSGYKGPEGTLIREQQVKMLDIPKTGIVVISDYVENVADIHPKFKKPVGERLANLALGDHYGKKDITYKMPLYQSMKIEKGKIRIAIADAPNGLVMKNNEKTEFEIAGEDKKFYPAKVKVDGSTVIVSAKEVKNPVAVRYSWASGALPTLFSKEGLPVSSFRTDDWPTP